MRTFFCGVLFLLLGSGVSRAQVIDYFQGFPTSVASGAVPLTGYNWSGYYGNGTIDAVSASAGTGASVPNAQLSPMGRSPAPMSNINATAPVGSTVGDGAAFIAAPGSSASPDPYSFLLVANPSEYPINTSNGSTLPADFTWVGAGNTGDTQQLAIELTNGQWYASSTVLTINTTTFSAASFKADAQTDFTNFSTAASGWYLLNFSTTAGSSTLSIGSALSAPLPTGTYNIMAFGVYLTDGQPTTPDHNFIDDFEIDAAPEPTMGLLLLAPLALLRGRPR